ncbi:hypothetical protein DYB35_006662 [Aphanomyces astaci]|uniref:GOLD domain-containing protein n=1 Tax=Aphanomyces astaci TaxID=112090 RepID=A0A3R6Y1I6_APHAT|nr:hypothetical protein DYB35_006662 [Aphanomyces astaci]
MKAHGLPWGVLGLAFICCLLPARGVTAGSSFAFDVYGGQEECFREDIVLRSLHSDLFLHFELLEPRGPADALHVKLLSPSGVPVTTWAHATANNTSLQLRESGLYSLCFTSTRAVIASFAVDFASKPGIEVTLAAIPDHRLSFYDRVISNHGVMASTGGSLLFDIADVVRGTYTSMRVLVHLSTSHQIQVAEDGDVRLAAGARDNGEYATPSESFLIRRRRPTLSVEDLGLPVLQSIGRFRYAVWDLKGELISIIQHERRTAESVQDRLVVGAVLTNALWVGAALYQVLYVRRLLARG